MSAQVRIVAIVCIAVFAFTAVTTVATFALFDAQTPIDGLFCAPAATAAPAVENDALPAAPVVDVRSPRAPPLS